MATYRNLTLPQLQKLAQELGVLARTKNMVIGLSGNLGSGKTTFAKAFASALGIQTLKSPTFIVSQRYTLKNKFLYHLDLYRLKTAKDLQAIGVDEILSEKNIVLIEWVEKFPAIKKQCDILIKFQIKPNNLRNVEIKSN